MKRPDLFRKLEDAGCLFVRRGGKHDSQSQINEFLAKHTLKKLTA
jgi:hypothetical protein